MSSERRRAQDAVIHHSTRLSSHVNSRSYGGCRQITFRTKWGWSVTAKQYGHVRWSEDGRLTNYDLYVDTWGRVWRRLENGEMVKIPIFRTTTNNLWEVASMLRVYSSR